MTEGPVSYEYITTVDVNRLCIDVFGDNNRVTQWLDDRESAVGGPAVTCALVAAAGGAAGAIGGPVTVVAGAKVAGKICVASAIGCAAETMFSGMTTCNGIQIDVYGRRSTVASTPVLFVPRCDGYLNTDDVVNTIESYANGAADTAGSHVSDGVDTASDIAGDLADGGGNLLSEGADLIGF
ncbi:hypothetical protein [Natronobiforma cellulositropha]|uniref:hypothetical protein n=1 Tax=Natronobiforma cellulositropha TaxID=1679076 RepID=UPI0021D5D15D|nr:hypothetical protein [Natronobiforma cellulositropha]